MDRKDWMKKNAETGKMEKKIGIDDLIREIHDTEAPDLPGFVEKEQQERIEDGTYVNLISEETIVVNNGKIAL